MSGYYDKWNWWQRLQASVFSLPSSPPVNIDNSVVAVMDRDNQYLPIRDEHFFSSRDEMLFVLFYILAWVGMLYILFDKRTIKAYIAGFLFGLMLIALEWWSYNAMSWVYVNNQNLRAYSVNFPEVVNLKKGELDYKPNMELIKPEVGDYKILLENNVIPQSRKDIYFLPAQKYVEYQNKADIVGEDLGTYLDGQFKHEYGYADQKQPAFAAKREVNLSDAAFYIVIICITWALYTSRAGLSSPARTAWLIGAVGTGLLTSGLTYDTGTARDRITFLYVMRRTLILSISFAVTAILL